MAGTIVDPWVVESGCGVEKSKVRLKSRVSIHRNERADSPDCFVTTSVSRPAVAPRRPLNRQLRETLGMGDLLHAELGGGVGGVFVSIDDPVVIPPRPVDAGSVGGYGAFQGAAGDADRRWMVLDGGAGWMAAAAEKPARRAERSRWCQQNRGGTARWPCSHPVPPLRAGRGEVLLAEPVNRPIEDDLRLFLLHEV